MAAGGGRGGSYVRVPCSLPPETNRIFSEKKKKKQKMKKKPEQKKL